MIKFLENSKKSLFTEYPITTDIYALYRFHQTLEAYKPTPLVPLKNYAEKNGIQIEGLEKPKSDIHEDEEEDDIWKPVC